MFARLGPSVLGLVGPGCAGELRGSGLGTPIMFQISQSYFLNVPEWIDEDLFSNRSNPTVVYR